MTSLMDVSLHEYIYISQIFFYIIPIMGLPTAWFVDRYGFRTAINFCLLLVIIRNQIRALFFLPHLDYWKMFRFAYWLTFNLLQQWILVFYYSLPLKISENWFSASEMTVAWSLMIVAPIFGSACSSLSVPQYVLDTSLAYRLAWVNTAASVISALVVLSCITRSKPKYAPSERELKENHSIDEQSLVKNLQALARDKNVIIHLVVLCSYDTFVITINSILQDVLSASGFSAVETGRFLAIMALASVVLQVWGAALLPSVADSRSAKKLDGEQRLRKCKLYILLLCLTFCLYSIALTLRDYPEQQWWLAVGSSLVYTLLRFWATPLYNDLLAHLISGSVSQPTVAAVQMILQALFSVIFSVVFVYLRQVDTLEDLLDVDEGDLEKDSSLDGQLEGRPNYSWSILFLACTSVAATCLYLACFDGKKRPIRRQQSASEQVAETA